MGAEPGSDFHHLPGTDLHILEGFGIQLDLPGPQPFLILVGNGDNQLFFNEIGNELQGLFVEIPVGRFPTGSEARMEILAEADYVIDLGPEGGDNGGRRVASGPPQSLLKYTNKSHTARSFKRYLKGR